MPRTTIGTSLAALALSLCTAPSSNGAPPSNDVVFFVTGVETRYQLHTYDPLRGSRSIIELPGEPKDIHWTTDYGTLRLLVGNEAFECDWRVGASPRKTVTLPPASNTQG